MNLDQVRAGAYMDFAMVIILGMVSWHFNYMKERIEGEALQAKYLGVELSN
jgi:hypothetical protein